jgi:hypothetical protein
MVTATVENRESHFRGIAHKRSGARDNKKPLPGINQVRGFLLFCGG